MLDIAERNRYIWLNRMEMYKRLGAVIGPGVKYWPREWVCMPAGLAISVSRTVCLSRLCGFMSQHRGLSWDRRSRRGVK